MASPKHPRDDHICIAETRHIETHVLYNNIGRLFSRVVAKIDGVVLPFVLP